MGKPIAITDDMLEGEAKSYNMPVVTPKSKNMTYEYTGEGGKMFLTFDAEPGDVYSSQFVNFGTKSGDDLVVTTLFTKSNGTAKTVKTTIKNYFANPYADYSASLRTYDVASRNWMWTGNLAPITPGTTVGTNYLFAEGTTFDANNISYLMGTKGADEYLSNGAHGSIIWDQKGNDEYISRHTNVADTVYDMAGNDDYRVDNQSLGDVAGMLYVTDYKGKDEYYAGGQSARLKVNDFAGNDEYEIEAGGVFEISDYKGNDEYEIESNGTSSVFNNSIKEWKGNDEYTLYEAQGVSIYEFAGKDTYNIIDSTGVMIDDHAGNDTYNVASEDIDSGDLEISDDKGNDKYNLIQVRFDDEPEDDVITDYSGNDKYTMKDVMNISIQDYKGNDKYITVAETNDDALSYI